VNVLVVSRESPPVGGGAGYVALHLARELTARHGHTIHMVTMACDDLPRYELLDGVHIHRVWCGRRQRESSYLHEMMFFLLRAVAFGRKLIRQHQIELVHAHAIIPDGLIALLSSWGRVPVVATAHGTDVPGYNANRFAFVHQLLRPVWPLVMKRLSRVVAPSQYIAELLHDSYADYVPSLIHYGIDDGIFNDDEIGNKNNDFLIVSRLERRKNFHLFFEAAKGIETPLRIHVVGEGEMLETLKTQAKSMPQHEVVFHGWLANGSEEWKSLYSQSRYFIFPSQSENYPVCLLEAGLAEMVILASDIPGNREVLGDAALFFEPDSVSGIRDIVSDVLQKDAKALDTIAKSVRAKVIASASWLTVESQYNRLYEEAIALEVHTNLADASVVDR